MPKNRVNYYEGSYLDTAKQYRVIGNLGDGIYGSVKLCSNGYAVKILDKCDHQGICDRDNCSVRRTHLNEKRYVDRIKGRPHPNLVEVYDIFKSQDELYCIKMKHLKGVSLQEKRKKYKGYLPENYAAFVAQNIYSGLAYLENALKIRNLDLKPANIMQKERREYDDWISSPWVLIDFGFSGEVKENQSAINLKFFVGTPAYFSPEKAGEGECRESTNLYVSGAIIFEILLNRLLHRLADNVPRVDHIRREAILEQINDSAYVPKEIRNYLRDTATPLCTSHIEKCLAFNPANRFQTTLDALNSKWITQFKTAENRYDFSRMPRPQSSSQRLITPPQAPGRHKAPLQASSLPKNTVSRVAGASTGSQPGSTTKKVSSVQSGSGPSPLTLRPRDRSPKRIDKAHQVPKLTNPQPRPNAASGNTVLLEQTGIAKDKTVELSTGRNIAAASSSTASSTPDTNRRGKKSADTGQSLGDSNGYFVLKIQHRR